MLPRGLIVAFALLAGATGWASQCGPSGCWPAPTPSVSMARVSHADGRGASHGTATLVAHRGERSYFLTCAHVFEGAGQTRIALPGSATVAGTVVAMDRRHDLAVIETARVSATPVEVEWRPSGELTACGFGPTGQRLAEVIDPATGEPVLINATTVLVMPAYRHAAHRVFNAAEISYTPSGAATTTIAANPLGNYSVHESRLLYRRAVASGVSAESAKKMWFMGDFKKAFAYMENWPITVTQAPIGSEADFTSDIVLRFKASERGAAAVLNPRYVVQCRG